MSKSSSVSIHHIPANVVRIPSPIKIAWRPENVGRKFIGCGLYANGESKCDTFNWIDSYMKPELRHQHLFYEHEELKSSSVHLKTRVEDLQNTISEMNKLNKILQKTIEETKL
ncbi:hypothetical protein FRX31_004714 [Thalictrum thalictroides]|uniref:Zinc finger GRF-type domain-containing protein n=1 Tax=Thalictrum thalictroides TaxID=46969 RepID=A0A7J6X7U6_THATH|nr:hypothetical protein FRX31_004714 [Thalictrum thalictroides]